MAIELSLTQGPISKKGTDAGIVKKYITCTATFFPFPPDLKNKLGGCDIMSVLFKYLNEKTVDLIVLYFYLW